MSFRDADRGQSIQIGAVLLFGVLVILLASYQAVIVPDQNRGIEASHVDTITQQFQELRNAVVSMPSSQTDRSVTLTLGVQYPSRVVAVNPPSPTGVVRTVETGPERVNLTVANAVAADAEVDDYWTGTNRSVNTGALVYRPGYNEYRNPPRIAYENSVLRHEFDDNNLTRAGQRLVDGRRLTLVALNGTLDLAASDSVSVDLQAVSASSRQISVENESGANVTIDVASRHGATWWEETLREDGEFTDQGGYVVDVTGSPIPNAEFDVVHVELAQGETYTLRMAKVGLGTNVVGEDPAYLTDVDGDGRTIQEGSTAQLVLEPRDELNNPVSGVEVHGRVESGSQTGSLVNETVTTDEDGRAVFEYEADAIDGTASEPVRADFSHAGAPEAGYDAGAPENASLSVTVENTDGSGVDGGGGGGSAPYSLLWEDTSSAGVTCDAPTEPDRCTLDASQTTQMDLRLGTDPTAANAPLSYAVNDTTTGTLDDYDSSTNQSGEDSRVFTAGSDGVVAVYAASGGSGDTLVVEVTNFGSGGGTTPPVVTSTSVTDQSNPGQGPRFDVSWSVSDNDGDLSQVDVRLIEEVLGFEATRDSTTVGVSGSSASGTNTLNHGSGSCGDDYIVEVEVTDQAGQTDTERQSVTANC